MFFPNNMEPERTRLQMSRNDVLVTENLAFAVEESTERSERSNIVENT